MALCSICAEFANRDPRYKNGVNIKHLFNEHFAPDIDSFLEGEENGVNVGGLCENCGLVRLSIKRESGQTYLIAHCWGKDNDVKPHKIAVVEDGTELHYIDSEIEKLCGKQNVDRKLTFRERWKLAYGEEFYDWLDKNEANGVFIIPSCGAETIWDKNGIPKLKSEIENYINSKTTNNESDKKDVSS